MSAGGSTARPFAGVAEVECRAADAFLARVPDATEPGPRGGPGRRTGRHRSPARRRGVVRRPAPHPRGPAARAPGTPRLRWPRRTCSLGAGSCARAMEPLLPRTSIDDDSIGPPRAGPVRRRGARAPGRRVGRQHLRHRHRPLQPAARCPSCTTSPVRNRSLLLGARRGPGGAATAARCRRPIFATPTTAGCSQLAARPRRARRRRGRIGASRTWVGPVRLDRCRRMRVARRRRAIRRRRSVATPRTSRQCPARRRWPPTLRRCSARRRTRRRRDDHAARRGRPNGRDRLRGLSGYLVPKPMQRSVTAVSFGSQKWAHWRPPDGRRRSCASPSAATACRRSTAPTTTSSPSVLDDLRRHLGVAFCTDRRPRHPLAGGVRAVPAASSRVGRPPSRPALAARGLFVAGSSYRGIGIPACVRDGSGDGPASGRPRVADRQDRSPWTYDRGCRPRPRRTAGSRRSRLIGCRRRAGRRRRSASRTAPDGRRRRPTTAAAPAATEPAAANDRRHRRRPPTTASATSTDDHHVDDHHHHDHDHDRPPPRRCRVSSPNRSLRRRTPGPPRTSVELGRIAIPKIGIDAAAVRGNPADHARPRARALAGLGDAGTGRQRRRRRPSHQPRTPTSATSTIWCRATSSRSRPPTACSTTP